MIDYGDLRDQYEWEVHRREHILDDRGGFMTFEIRPDAMYITEVYVVPAARKLGVARDMLARIEALALQWGRKQVWGTVDATTLTWRDSVAAQEACGFRLTAINGAGQALLVKDLAGSGAVVPVVPGAEVLGGSTEE